MAKTASQFTYSHKELVTLMLKDAGIHEGLWNLSVNFRLGAGAFGPTPEEVAPSGFVSVDAVGIQKMEPKEGQPIPPLTYDAKELNPEAKP
ncbi:MAG: hypothetical protein I8H87_00865 [Comamonadaceae bacterium]|jgi:hypothetical protein|nr:hypothetical protein [Comamonadaceae bacterium]